MNVMEYKYDVFISYSRKDYVDDDNNIIPNNPISAIIETFKKNQISFWLDEEGIYSGQEFKNIIIDAIHSSKVFLFISSTHSNESRWTKSEIFEAFDADKYIIPFKIEDCDYHKSLKFELRPLDFILYCGNEISALKELVRSVNNYKEIFAEKQRKEKEQSQLEEVKHQINEISTDYQIQATKQDAIRKDIIDLFLKVDIKQKTCPVCEKSVSIDATYCDRCGWPFPALPSLGDSKATLNRGLLTTLRANWKCIHQVADSKSKSDALKEENDALKEELKKKTDECNALKEELKKKTDECNTLKEELKKNTDAYKRSLDTAISISETISGSKSGRIPSNLKTIHSKSDIFVNIVVPCKYYGGFLEDSSNAQAIDISKLLDKLLEYGITLNWDDFKNCLTVMDIINVISKAANIKN